MLMPGEMFGSRARGLIDGRNDAAMGPTHDLVVGVGHRPPSRMEGMVSGIVSGAWRWSTGRRLVRRRECC